MEPDVYFITKKQIEEGFHEIDELDKFMDSLTSSFATTKEYTRYGKYARTVNHIELLLKTCRNQQLTLVKNEIYPLNESNIKFGLNVLDAFFDLLTHERQYNSQIGKSVVTSENIDSIYKTLRDTVNKPIKTDIHCVDDELMGFGGGL
jgi:hypothetical protein